MKIEVGKTYVVKVNDRNNIVVLGEVSPMHLKLFKLSTYIKFIKITLNALLVLSVLIFPPMIFFIRRKGNETAKLNDNF